MDTHVNATVRAIVNANGDEGQIRKIIEGFNFGVVSVPLTRARTTFETLEVDFDALPYNTRQHLVAYGLRQNLNDAHRSAKNSADAIALTEKRLKRLQDGTFSMRERAAGDPVEAEAIKIAIDFIKKAIRTSGEKLDAYETADLRELADALLQSEEDAADAIWAEAKRRVESKAAMGGAGGLLAKLKAKAAGTEETEESEESEETEESDA